MAVVSSWASMPSCHREPVRCREQAGPGGRGENCRERSGWGSENGHGVVNGDEGQEERGGDCRSSGEGLDPPAELLGSATDGAISATGPAMKKQMDRPATAALEQGGGDALLGPDEITATSGDDDDRAMGQRRRRQEAKGRQCSGLGHCSRGQAHGLQSKRTGQVVRGFRCRRRWARGLWRSSYLTSTNALSSGQSGCGATDLRKVRPCGDGSER